MHRGVVRDTTGGRDELHGPGDTFMVALPDRAYAGEVRAARYTITMFDTALLDEVAGTAGGHDVPVRFTGQRPVDAEAGRRLGRTVAFLRDTVLGGPAPAVDGLVVSTAARHLAAVALAALPSTLRDDGPRPADSRDAGTATLRRAMAFIEENAHRDIGLADIATAVCVTPARSSTRSGGTRPPLRSAICAGCAWPSPTATSGRPRRTRRASRASPPGGASPTGAFRGRLPGRLRGVAVRHPPHVPLTCRVAGRRHAWRRAPGYPLSSDGAVAPRGPRVCGRHATAQTAVRA
ncbi:AraC family transcriptional regulator [Streptomyces zhihengii]